MFETIIPLVLGVVQGLTEFLPVSSSGHLVLLQHFAGIEEPAILFDICVHVGTLMAVLLIFYKDILLIINEILKIPGKIFKEKQTSISNLIFENLELKTAFLIIIGTIPTGIIGIFFRKQVDVLFGNISLVGLMLITTGIFLGITRFIKPGVKTVKDMTIWTAIILGIIQGFAIIPGISRSGATITAALLMKMDRSFAGRFSFLLSIPSILGALVLELSKPVGDPIFSYPMILIASIISFAVGYVALKVLLYFVNQGRLYYFAPYCLLIGSGIIVGTF